MEVIQKLTKNYSLSDINIGLNNHVRENVCIAKATANDAEKTLNKMGFSIAGVCKDVPLSINLGNANMSVLVLREIESDNLYWMHIPYCVIQDWLAY